jgi:hypothetical protein
MDPITGVMLISALVGTALSGWQTAKATQEAEEQKRQYKADMARQRKDAAEAEERAMDGAAREYNTQWIQGNSMVRNQARATLQEQQTGISQSARQNYVGL